MVVLKFSSTQNIGRDKTFRDKLVKINRLLWNLFFPNDPKAMPYFHQDLDGSKKKNTTKTVEPSVWFCL